MSTAASVGDFCRAPKSFRQIELGDMYMYRRGDIYRRYVMTGGKINAVLFNPAPGIKVHAEMEIDGRTSGLQMISPPTGELQLLT